MFVYGSLLKVCFLGSHDLLASCEDRLTLDGRSCAIQQRFDPVAWFSQRRAPSPSMSLPLSTY